MTDAMTDAVLSLVVAAAPTGQQNTPWWIVLFALIGLALAIENVRYYRNLSERRERRKSQAASTETLGRLAATAVPNLCAGMAFLVFSAALVLAIEFESGPAVIAALVPLAIFLVLVGWSVKELVRPGRWNPGPRWVKQARSDANEDV